MKRLLLSSMLASCLFVAVLVGVLNSTVILPPSKSADADPETLSGDRAMMHLESIAAEPHPWYSDDNERIFRYILSHGDSLASKYGTDVIETTTQTATISYTGPQRDEDVAVDPVDLYIINVAFLIKGTTTGVDGAAIQVSAHYDGVRMGPAATDDGAGCAIMLELASVLASRAAAGSRLERDVLILFVDAEEDGLVGADYWASGVDGGGNGIFNPWSLLPSFAVNIEGSGTATSGAMLIRSNSDFATDMYRKHAAYPKAFSLTEWIYKTIQIGMTDSDIYWTQGIHLMDLIWVENRWAYHSKDDDINHVKSSSLQSCGDNILSIVEGSSASANFPGRIPERDLIEGGVVSSQGSVGMDSGTVYFSILGGTTIWMPYASARAMFVAVAVVLGLTMPFLGDDRDGDGRADGQELGEDAAADGNSGPSARCKLRVSRRAPRFARAAAQHASVALLNFVLGILASVAAFAAFGMWKSPSAVELERRYDEAIVAWGGIGAARSFLSLFAACGTTLLVYAPFRTGRCWRRRGEEAPDEAGGDARGNGTEAPDGESRSEGEHSPERRENEEKASLTSSPPLDNGTAVEGEDAERARLERLGRDARLGVFYFYDALLLILGAGLPDAAGAVLWQPIFMWIASLADAILRRRMEKSPERMQEGGDDVPSPFRRWLSYSFLSAFPALLLLPMGLYILVNVFGYFMDDLGLWFGAPAVDSVVFGLILPLLVPCWLPLPGRAFRVLCTVIGLAWAATAIACMAI